MKASLATPIFLALEPDDATTKLIWRYKHRVRELVGDQLYLDDPPHLTFYLAAFADVEEVLDLSRQAVSALSAPAIRIAGWHTFYDDPLTGNHTLVLDFPERDREQLRDMQARIVDSLSSHRDGAASLDRISGRWSQLSDSERKAAEQYGFPYIGAGWHPHFTIASIRPDDWPIVERELLCNPPEGELICPRIQVFQLLDNEPELLESIELAPESKANSNSLGASPRCDPSHPDSRELKDDLIEAIWSVVDRHDWILSATLTGSFLTDQTLAAISDIDLVVIVEELNGPRFDGLQREFTQALTPALAERGLKLLINPTLGPRKLNDDATAVLHLMLYSREAHHQHAIKSPFTCLDWQRSTVYRKRSMAEVYPVFGLQPHHFVSARRGLRDYLHDFERGVVSYREIECSVDRYSESRREEPMTTRDRYEYAYHVMRFLMQNLLKLVRRSNRVNDGAELVEEYSSVFPHEASAYAKLYQELRWRKARRDFSDPISRLRERLTDFVLDFESQFRVMFSETATRHVFFRHAPTKLNQPTGDDRRYQGRTDVSIEPVTAEQLAELIEAITDFSFDSVYSSPLQRCRQSLEQLGHHIALPAAIDDARLMEIDYGACEGLSVSQAKVDHADLFAAWDAGDDPRFPGGENTADVLARLNDFLDSSDRLSAGNSIVCAHNVVLRCLVGEGLGVPRAKWHRISVPHLAPISVVRTRDYGWFIDLEESVERRLFAKFLHPPAEAR